MNKFQPGAYLLLGLCLSIAGASCGNDDDDSGTTLEEELERLRQGFEREGEGVRNWVCDCAEEWGDPECPVRDDDQTSQGPFPESSEIKDCDRELYRSFQSEIREVHDCFIMGYRDLSESLQSFECIDPNAIELIDSTVDEMEECKRLHQDEIDRWVDENDQERCMTMFGAD